MSVKLIKSRIRTAGNISQIAKAMEMVAGSKRGRSQDQATAGKPYSGELDKVLARLAGTVEAGLHPLLTEGEEGKPVGLVLITTDKGLCGGLNSSLVHEMEKWTKDLVRGEKSKLRIVAVGKKGRDYCVSRGYELEAEFTGLRDYPGIEDIRPMVKIVVDGFSHGVYSQVWVAYADFVSTLVQRAEIRPLLPIRELGGQEVREKRNEEEEREELVGEYLFEPNPGKVLDWLLPYYVENQVYHLILEAKASEHSARMVAMKNARENATEIVSDLTLEYNRLRQQKITNELLDTVSAKKALAGGQ
jgi:F-type H+-transporting ATPase subunit gamma